MSRRSSPGRPRERQNVRSSSRELDRPLSPRGTTGSDDRRAEQQGLRHLRNDALRLELVQAEKALASARKAEAEIGQF